MSNQGKLIIFSAPSGSGKTTIVKHLLSKGLNLEFSISACSRPPRGQEQNGKDYYFLTAEEFQSKVQNNEFVEWEEVYEGRYYGTLWSEMERIWDKGNHVLFDVDVKGGISLKKKFGSQALSVFVMPPSLDELRKRLIGRNTDPIEEIERRLAKAEEEMTFAPQFDAVVVNDELGSACDKAIGLVTQFLNIK
jgi:guanylate kinase